MYTSEITIERVQGLIRSKNLIQKDVLFKCGLSENILKKMSDGRGISSFYLAKIADELDCSVDYLLGRTENVKSHYCPIVTTGEVSGNYNAIVGGSADVTIANTTISGQAAALLDIFNNLEPMEQAKLLVYADKLKERKESD